MLYIHMFSSHLKNKIQGVLYFTMFFIQLKNKIHGVLYISIFSSRLKYKNQKVLYISIFVLFVALCWLVVCCLVSNRVLFTTTHFKPIVFLQSVVQYCVLYITGSVLFIQFSAFLHKCGVLFISVLFSIVFFI